MKLVSITEDTGSVIDAIDALDRELDLTWALIAAIEATCRDNDDDPYARASLALAHVHLDRLSDIRELLRAKERIE